MAATYRLIGSSLAVSQRSSPALQGCPPAVDNIGTTKDPLVVSLRLLDLDFGHSERVWEIACVGTSSCPPVPRRLDYLTANRPGNDCTHPPCRNDRRARRLASATASAAAESRRYPPRRTRPRLTVARAWCGAREFKAAAVARRRCKPLRERRVRWHWAYRAKAAGGSMLAWPTRINSLKAGPSGTVGARSRITWVRHRTTVTRTCDGTTTSRPLATNSKGHFASVPWRTRTALSRDTMQICGARRLNSPRLVWILSRRQERARANMFKPGTLSGSRCAHTTSRTKNIISAFRRSLRCASLRHVFF